MNYPYYGGLKLADFGMDYFIKFENHLKNYFSQLSYRLLNFDRFIMTNFDFKDLNSIKLCFLNLFCLVISPFLKGLDLN